MCVCKRECMIAKVLQQERKIEGKLEWKSQEEKAETAKFLMRSRKRQNTKTQISNTLVVMEMMTAKYKRSKVEKMDIQTSLMTD